MFELIITIENVKNAHLKVFLFYNQLILITSLNLKILIIKTYNFF